MLSQSDLDRLIEESKRQDTDKSSNKQPGLEEAITAAQAVAAGGESQSPAAEASPPRARRFRKPGVILPFIRDNAARVAASLLVGGMAALSTGLLLHLNRESPGGLRPRSGVELQVALARAGD